jgi:cell wall-associated NlpC family hydrolase
MRPRTAVGLTTAALASVTLLSEVANAAPAPSPEQHIAEVQKKLDSLSHQAEVATERYNGAKEKTAQQNAAVNKLLAEAAQKTQALNDARRQLGIFAAAQYRTGGFDTTANYLLAENPQQLLDQNHMNDVLGQRQKVAVDNFRTQQAAATKKRLEAAASLTKLTTQQAQLRAAKADVQTKLGATQKLLNSLNAQEKARLAAIEAAKEAEARKKAAAIAAAEKAAAAKAAQAKQQAGDTTEVPANASIADKAIAFARAQEGEPYVWGATGPSSWDCSGLTQAAYKAAGVTLPRTTVEQVLVGTRVSQSDMKPGDLVFFYSDHSHVGLYIGGGMMIHAPHTGTVVKEAPITEMPIYGIVRPY